MSIEGVGIIKMNKRSSTNNSSRLVIQKQNGKAKYLHYYTASVKMKHLLKIMLGKWNI